jgi:probable rRNA maturation factor
MSVRVDVQRAAAEDSIPDNAFVAAWVTRAIEAAGDAGDSEVSVRIVDAGEIRALNRDYRGKDQSTNVLSFPAGEVAGQPGNEPVLLGDIVVCASVVRHESEAQGKATPDHWAHILVHGALHLLGYDHQSNVEADAMEALEITILGAHGIDDPYGAASQNC